MSQTPNLDAARASLQQAIDQANAIVKPVIDAMREAGVLTPAPEPAAPAVDDDLLQAVGREARAAYFTNEGANRDVDDDELHTGRDLLASEPMQRLRAAWTAEEHARADRNAAAANANADMIVELHRERDEAYRQKTEWQATAGRLATERDTLKVKVEVLQVEGDEARAEVQRLEQERAAQQLPDVGPVTRTDPDEDGWTWLRVGDHRGFFNPHISADDHRLSAARELALAAYKDAEAANEEDNELPACPTCGGSGNAREEEGHTVNEHADTSSDDEVRKLAVDLYDVGLHTVGPDDLDNRQLAERLIKLGWHRARGGQEAGRG